jgi:glycosyltransferase involved in cell wall biosynthesis
VLSSDVVGGCETGCINLAAGLQQAGFAQEVVFMDPGDGSRPASSRLEAIGIATHLSPLDPDRRGFVRRFAAHCRKRGKVVVVSHAFGVHVHVARAAKLGGAGKVLAIAGNPPPDGLVPWLKSALYVQAARRWNDLEIGCSNYVVDQMRRRYRLPRRRVAALHYIVPVEEVRARAASARAMRDGDSAPVIAMVARLDPIKNHRIVLEAFAMVLKAVPAARLRLIGDGPERRNIERRASELGIADRVDLLGTRRDVPELLGTSDLFVYGTTRNEGFGIVLAEAMAAGLPVVATDVGPCREVLGNGAAGTLVANGDPAALAEGMVAELRRGDRAGRGAQASSWAAEHYSARVIVPQFLSLVGLA